MVDINEIYKSNSDNIKAEDIGNNMWTMTIKSADVKEFKDDKKGIERKLVLTFHEWEKSLPLNVTNARAIADLYGHNSNDWVGRQIMLFTMTVDFGGKPTLGIRVRAPAPPQQTMPQRQPGQIQPQAATTMRSPNPPQQPAGYPPHREFAPLPDEGDEIPF